jgi:type VI secretion system protein ImpH
VVLHVDTSLGFPKSDIAALELREADHGPPYRLVVTFLGLHGSSSPLPTFYAEDVLHDEPNTGALAAFLNLFHHRLLSLFYRSWIRFRHHFMFTPGGKDEFSRAMFCLIGLGGRSLVDGAGFPAVRTMQFAGLITQKPHSAAALAGVLQGYFDGVPVHITQGVGRWVVMRADQRSSLGARCCRLADSLYLGERVHDRLSKFRITLGPLDFDAYLQFLPEGEWHEALKRIVRLFVVDRLDFDLELVLRADETPRLSVGLSRESRLGHTTGFFAGRRAQQEVAVVFA